MNIKSIVVAASGESEDAGVLAVAATLAARCAGEVRVVPAFPDPAADLVYYGAVLNRDVKAEAAERIRASEREIQERVEGWARAAGAKAKVVVDKRELQPAVALASAAVLADLVVFGAGAARETFSLAGLFAETLLAARAPTLLVRPGAPGMERAALAWDGSAQAGRAVRAALPLLQLAEGVLIVRNVEDLSVHAPGAACERLEAYLALHGVREIATRDVRGADVADSLLAAAQADKCGLLVCGAYGRPRLYELVLGGTTRALARVQSGPHVLLAH